MALALPARAQHPDEARDLRVTNEAGQIRLDWQPPSSGTPDTYRVRRCLLASLRGLAFGAPYFGDCVGSATATTWSEPTPDDSVFYLVSGVTAGAEGSLGDMWNGHDDVPRMGDDCAPASRTITLIVSITSSIDLCGSDLRITYPPALMTFDRASCSGLQASFLGATNSTTPGLVIHACANATPVAGPGELARFVFRSSACPMGASAFGVARCQLVEDCATTVDATCVLRVQ